MQNQPEGRGYNPEKDDIVEAVATDAGPAQEGDEVISKQGNNLKTEHLNKEELENLHKNLYENSRKVMRGILEIVRKNGGINQDSRPLLLGTILYEMKTLRDLLNNVSGQVDWNRVFDFQVFPEENDESIAQRYLGIIERAINKSVLDEVEEKLKEAEDDGTLEQLLEENKQSPIEEEPVEPEEENPWDNLFASVDDSFVEQEPKIEESQEEETVADGDDDEELGKIPDWLLAEDNDESQDDYEFDDVAPVEENDTSLESEIANKRKAFFSAMDNWGEEKNERSFDALRQAHLELSKVEEDAPSLDVSIYSYLGKPDQKEEKASLNSRIQGTASDPDNPANGEELQKIILEAKRLGLASIAARAENAFDEWEGAQARNKNKPEEEEENSGFRIPHSLANIKVNGHLDKGKVAEVEQVYGEMLDDYSGESLNKITDDFKKLYDLDQMLADEHITIWEIDDLLEQLSDLITKEIGINFLTYEDVVNWIANKEDIDFDNVDEDSLRKEFFDSQPYSEIKFLSDLRLEEYNQQLQDIRIRAYNAGFTVLVDEITQVLEEITEEVDLRKELTKKHYMDIFSKLPIDELIDYDEVLSNRHSEAVLNGDYDLMKEIEEERYWLNEVLKGSVPEEDLDEDDELRKILIEDDQNIFARWGSARLEDLRGLPKKLIDRLRRKKENDETHDKDYFLRELGNINNEYSGEKKYKNGALKDGRKRKKLLRKIEKISDQYDEEVSRRYFENLPEDPDLKRLYSEIEKLRSKLKKEPSRWRRFSKGAIRVGLVGTVAGASLGAGFLLTRDRGDNSVKENEPRVTDVREAPTATPRAPLTLDAYEGIDGADEEYSPELTNEDRYDLVDHGNGRFTIKVGGVDIFSYDSRKENINVEVSPDLNSAVITYDQDDGRGGRERVQETIELVDGSWLSSNWEIISR